MSIHPEGKSCGHVQSRGECLFSSTLLPLHGGIMNKHWTELNLCVYMSIHHEFISAQVLVLTPARVLARDKFVVS